MKSRIEELYDWVLDQIKELNELCSRGSNGNDEEIEGQFIAFEKMKEKIGSDYRRDVDFKDNLNKEKL